MSLDTELKDRKDGLYFLRGDLTLSRVERNSRNRENKLLRIVGEGSSHLPDLNEAAN